jgi:hypothetical protein
MPNRNKGVTTGKGNYCPLARCNSSNAAHKRTVLRKEANEKAMWRPALNGNSQNSFSNRMWLALAIK